MSPAAPVAETARAPDGCWAVLVHGDSRADFTETPEGGEFEVSYHNVATGPRRAVVVLKDEPPFRSRITGGWCGWARFVAWAE
ncbi:MAG: hypothetical protein OXU74_06625 [Gemmatimonadota bacterium]|nr:hypothetical protein [Gemmatimonadota bacterium]